MDGEVFFRDVRQSGEQPRHHTLRGKRAGDVGNDECDIVCRLDQIDERRGSDRVADGRLKFGGFIAQAGEETRLDHMNVSRGNLDAQAVTAIRQRYWHAAPSIVNSPLTPL